MHLYGFPIEKTKNTMPALQRLFSVYLCREGRHIAMRQSTPDSLECLAVWVATWILIYVQDVEVLDGFKGTKACFA